MHRILPALAALLLVPACATRPAVLPEPPATRATPFAKYPQEKLGTRMGQMAERLRRIEELVLIGGLTAGDRESIVGWLGELKATADALDPHEDFGGHEFFVDRLEKLRSDASYALTGMQSEPADVNGLGRLTTTCTRCHNEKF